MTDEAEQPGDSPLEHAIALAACGLRVLPIKPGHKRPPMQSWQHAASIDPTVIRKWWNGLYRGHGVGIAMGRQPNGRRLFAVDVDEHDPAASGSDTLAQLEHAHGKLPDTVRSITGSGGAHLIFDSGDIEVTNGAAGALGPGIDVRGEGGQIVVAPSIHPDGGVYAWEHGCAPWETAIAPAPAWLLAMVVPAVVVEAEVPLRKAPPLPPTDTPADRLRNEWDWRTELYRRGWQLHHADARTGDTHWTRPGKEHRQGSSGVLHGNDGPFVVFTTDASVEGMWRAGKVGNGCVSLSPIAYVAAYDHGGDVSAAARALRAAQVPQAPPEAVRDTQDVPEGIVDDAGPARDGATFILDENAELEVRWGKGSEVLWARGESLLVVGPPGVGKTTLAGQIVGGLIDVLDNVLGYPVTPATKVLYLAMDRPRQMRRAMRRLFGEQHRDALADRLVVRPGPLAADLGKKPELLLELAHAHGCDVVVLDSLKDAAVKLVDDEVGGNVNRAIQMCNAADVDVLVLHHQRKGDNTSKPTALSDVYGSTWIGAGAGSVILLWGEPGSELVELTHLKQPADPVGPLKVEHDHHRGTSTVSHGFDALAFLRHKGDLGATVSEASQAQHGGIQASGSSKWKQTERRLRALVRDGLATTKGRPKVGVPARYFSMDTPHGHPLAEGPWTDPWTTPWTPMDTNEETPAHAHGHPHGHMEPAPPMDTLGGVYIPPQGPGGSNPDLDELF